MHFWLFKQFLLHMLQGELKRLFIGFNYFLHLLTDKDAIDFFYCVQAHMHKSSRFVIDIYVPNPLFLYRPEEVRFPVLEYTDSHTNEQVFVEENNIYDSETEINKLNWFFSTVDKKDFDSLPDTLKTPICDTSKTPMSLRTESYSYFITLS